MKRSVSLLPLAVAACVPASKPPAAPPPPRVVAAPAPAPVPALGPDWQDWPVTPGAWAYRRVGAGSSATFGAGVGVLVTISCTGGMIELDRAAAGASSLTVRTSSVTRALPVRPVSPGTARATLQPTDPLLDAVAFSRGRFTVEQAGAAPLVLPPHAEVARVVEDCRP